MARTGFVCLVVAALSVCIAAPANALTVSVTKQAVTANEVTRGGSVLFYAVAYEADAVPKRVRHATVVSDDDGDGVVALSPADGVPLLGIWAAVDMTTGDAALGSRRGYRLIPFDQSPEASFKRDESGEKFSRLEQAGGDIELLVVRPGQGAWTFRIVDGSENDVDYTHNAVVTFPLDRLTPLEEGDLPPAALHDGDVVVMIDAGDMRAWTGTLGDAK